MAENSASITISLTCRSRCIYRLAVRRMRNDDATLVLCATAMEGDDYVQELMQRLDPHRKAEA
jgi:hypothetical protein